LSAFGPIVDGIVVPAEPRQLTLNAIDQSNGGGSGGSSAALLANQGGGSSPLNSANLADRQMAGGVNGGGVPYDLLFGITRVEAPYVFSGIEERAGIDLQRRDRLLRTLVRNLFDYHQQVSEEVLRFVC